MSTGAINVIHIIFHSVWGVLQLAPAPTARSGVAAHPPLRPMEPSGWGEEPNQAAYFPWHASVIQPSAGTFQGLRLSVRRDVAVSRETVDKGWHIGPCASEAEVLEVAQVQGHWEGDRADYARNCPQSYPQGYPLMRLDTDTALGARPPISVTHSPGPRGVPAGLPHRT